MKHLFTCLVVFVSMVMVLIYQPVFAQGNGEGTKAAEKIKDRIDVENTDAKDKEKAKKDLMDAIDAIGREHPDDAAKVKEEFRKKAKEIKDKYKNIKETLKWINDLLAKLMDNEYIKANATGLQDAMVTTKATGTGRTTGHIATLSVSNTSSQPQAIIIGPFFIPSTSQYQPYVVPTPVKLTLKPNETKEVPLNGFCADIHKAPVPEGSKLPPVDSWIEANPNGIAENWSPNTKNGWNPGTGTQTSGKGSGGNTILIPGTDRPLGYTIDINKHPKEAAPVLLTAINNISNAYDKMASEGKINTPFSSNPEKERESVIQQTFWIYAAALTGTAYKVADFKKKTEEQFNESTGKNVKDIPDKQQKELNKGIDTFWNTFQAVGVEAKVILAQKEEDEED